MVAFHLHRVSILCQLPAIPSRSGHRLLLWGIVLEDIHLRVATLDDLPAIVDCWQGLIEAHRALNAELYDVTPQAASSFSQATARHIADPVAWVQVAERHVEGARPRAVGYLIAREGMRPPWYTVRRVGMILDVFVRPEARRLGVARALMESAREAFVARGVRWLQVCYDPMNEASTCFWEGSGFSPLLIEGYRPC